MPTDNAHHKHPLVSNDTGVRLIIFGCDSKHYVVAGVLDKKSAVGSAPQAGRYTGDGCVINHDPWLKRENVHHLFVSEFERVLYLTPYRTA